MYIGPLSMALKRIAVKFPTTTAKVVTKVNPSSATTKANGTEGLFQAYAHNKSALLVPQRRDMAINMLNSLPTRSFTNDVVDRARSNPRITHRPIYVIKADSSAVNESIYR